MCWTTATWYNTAHLLRCTIRADYIRIYSMPRHAA